MTDLITPSIHMNGTSAESLLEQQRHVYDAADALLTALAAATPHGRDYYVQDNGEVMGPKYRMAQAQHRVRMVMADTIKNEASEIAQAVMAQES